MRKMVPADCVESRCRTIFTAAPLDIAIYKSMEEETLRNKDDSSADDSTLLIASPWARVDQRVRSNFSSC